jgi:hypothetical protein
MPKILTIDTYKKIAQDRGGYCLSKKYFNSKSKLRWRCADGHEWDTAAANVKNSGSWCPVCSGNRLGTIEEMILLAEQRGGLCLSKKYINSKSKLRWRCADGHEWEMIPNSVRNGQWCPNCHESFGESICRYIFETLLEAEFIKKKPVWLVDRNGSRLELDGYNETLGLAFEHQGLQHYIDSGYHRGDNGYRKLVERDKDKKIACTEHKITLIEIPEIPTLLPVNKAEEYIRSKLIEAGFNKLSQQRIDVDKIINASYARNVIDSLREFAAGKNGALISKRYFGNKTKLIWKCENGHTWEMTPTHIRSGHWCPDCAKKRKYTIEQIHKLAKDNKGECLSQTYINRFAKLRWKCENGHVWEAAPSSIIQGHWRAVCSGSKKHTIELMQEIATKKGGLCLSKKYVNAHTKLLWRCKDGHTWEAKPNDVKNNNSWCPKCSRLIAAKKRAVTMGHDVAQSAFLNDIP